MKEGKSAVIVLLAVFVAMVLLGALADRARKKKGQQEKTHASEELPLPEVHTEPAETQPVPAEMPSGSAKMQSGETAVAPLKIRPVRRSDAKPPIPVMPVMPPIPAAPEAMTAEQLAERLRQIQAMHDRGELTKREYRRMRSRLLDRFCG